VRRAAPSESRIPTYLSSRRGSRRHKDAVRSMACW